MRLYSQLSSVSRLIPAIALIALPSLQAGAQTTFAFQGLYAGTDTGFVADPANGTANNAGNPFVGSKSWSGLDSQGNAQVMTASGTAWSWASFGKIHVYADAKVENPYYNANNPVYFDENMSSPDPNGSPDLIAVHGNAGFSDKFKYTGTQGSGYKVNYWFRLTGTTSGDTEAGLNFFSQYSTGGAGDWQIFRTPGADALWITGWYDVIWGVETDVYSDFFGGLTTHVSQRPEGATIVGFGDYSHTLDLERIQMVDPTGNVFSGWDMQAASGTQYSLFRPGSPVPEPGTVALFIGAALAGLVVRRRR